jgi:hypothetical protein
MSENQSPVRSYLKAKRNLEDYCNICGERKKLTYDHIPPKCCFNDVKAIPLPFFSGEPEKYNPSCAQNGIKFRSICDACNNGLLGKYDKELECYVGKIKELFSTNEELQGTYNIPTKINRLARSIAGHMLAMRNRYSGVENLIDQELRLYLRDDQAVPPENFKLLMWFYPYSTVFIIRDVVASNVFNVNQATPDGLLSALSSFPTAFILTDGIQTCDLFDVFSACTSNIDEDVEIPFDFNSAFFPQSSAIRHMQWPCNISDDGFGANMLLCSENAINDAVYANRNNADIRERLQNRRKL